ncbi:MAG TPA: hypothetical protein VGC79_31390 [Polyangiaceae bacterium]
MPIAECAECDGAGGEGCEGCNGTGCVQQHAPQNPPGVSRIVYRILSNGTAELLCALKWLGTEQLRELVEHASRIIHDREAL